MQAMSPSRFEVYAPLIKSRKYWQNSLGIISCKRLRTPEYDDSEFQHIVDLLSSSDFRRLVAKHELQLVFTGGTFRRLRQTLEKFSEFQGRLHGLAPSALGVIQIANLVVYGHLRAVLFFNHMEDQFADSPQNLCLRRICNHYDTPLFEEYTSIEYLLRRWSKEQTEPPLRAGRFPAKDVAAYFGRGESKDEVLYRNDLRPGSRPRSRETLAVVSHNERKMTMLNFCLQHIPEILSYKRVLSTGTTGARLRDQSISALELLKQKLGAQRFRKLNWTPETESIEDFVSRKIQPFKSGPDGGDIQISSKVIDGTCHRVLFFQDPHTAHPHQFDIRLMEKAVQDLETAALFATSVRMAEIIV